MLMPMTQNGKFCTSSSDNLYTSIAKFAVAGLDTKLSVVSKPSIPQPRRSVDGSSPSDQSVIVKLMSTMMQ